MIYKPRNRRLCLPPVIAFSVDGVDWYIDDAEEYRGDVSPIAWGREGSKIRIVGYTGNRFTLCDERGRYLKRATCYQGEGKRRVRSFASMVDAAKAQAIEQIESCE